LPVSQRKPGLCRRCVQDLVAAEAEPEAEAEAEAEAEDDEEFMAELTAAVDAHPDSSDRMVARETAHQAREAAGSDKRPGE
jgi:hypothetical protein